MVCGRDYIYFIFLLMVMSVYSSPEAPVWKSVIIGGGGYVIGLVSHPSEPGLVINKYL